MVFDRDEYITAPLSIESELAKLFSRNDPLVVFEIGACEGEDSVRYSRFFPNAKIYAFEPIPSNVDLIRSNLSKYNVRNVSYFNKAVADKDGKAEFHVSEVADSGMQKENWDFGNKSSSLLPPDQHEKLFDFIKFEKKISVDTITVDTFCRQQNISRIDFVHMDVQGAELMVLKGASEMLGEIKAIWLEVSKIALYKNQPLAKDVQRFMKQHGFSLVKNTLATIDGDQLYVSKKFYPDAKRLFPDNRSIFTRLKNLFK